MSRAPQHRGRGQRCGLTWWAPSALALASAGCTVPVNIEIPSVPSARSAVVALGTPDAPLAQAIRLEDAPLALELAVTGPLPVLVLFYESDLAALGLDPGILEPAPSNFRALPAPTRAFSLDLESSEKSGAAPSVDVTDNVTSTALFKALRFDKGDAGMCIGLGGCYPASSGGLCEVPCPEPPSPTEPAKPELPAPDCGTWPKKRPAGLPGVSTPVDAVDLCDPGEIETCPDGHLWTPARECHPVAPGCVDWPAGLPAGAIYVDPLAAPGGDGQETAPFAMIADALAEARRRGGRPTIALAPRIIAGDEALDAEVDLRGCATELVGQIHVGARVGLSDVRLTGAASIDVASGAELDLSAVRVARSATTTAWLRVSGTATVTGALVVHESGGVEVLAGRMALRASELRDVVGVGVTVHGGEATLEEVAIATAPEGCTVPAACHAILVDGGELDATALIVQGGVGGGQSPFLELRGGAAQLTRIVLRGPSVEARAFHVSGAARLDADGVLTWNVGALRAESAPDARSGSPDVHVRNLFAYAQGELSQPMIAASGAQVRLESAVVFGYIKAVMASKLEVADLTLDGSASTPFGVDDCLKLEDRSRIDAHRLRIVKCHRNSLAMDTNGEDLVNTLEDLTIEDGGDVGLKLQNSSRGFFDGTRATVARLTIRNVFSSGVELQSKTGASLSDVRIAGVGSRDCNRFNCSGNGVFSEVGVRGDLSRFFIADCEGAGLSVGAGAEVKAHAGLIEGNGKGLQIFAGGTFSIQDVLDGVLVRDNEDDLSSPPPE